MTLLPFIMPMIASRTPLTMSRPDPRTAGTQVYLERDSGEPVYVGQLAGVHPASLTAPIYVLAYYDSGDLNSFRLAAEAERFSIGERHIKLRVEKRSFRVDADLLHNASDPEAYLRRNVPAYAICFDDHHTNVVSFMWPALMVQTADMDDLFDCDQFEPAA